MSEGTDSISKDVRTGLWRQKALGFNAIRLPFTFDILTRAARIFPQACTVASEQEVIDSVFPPGAAKKSLPLAPPSIWGARFPAAGCRSMPFYAVTIMRHVARIRDIDLFWLRHP
jgi:hypothetical protein